MNVVQEPLTAAPLKAASLAEDLKAWTACLTSTVVTSCGQLGWSAATRGCRLAELPHAGGQVYLGIDVIAFGGANDNVRWRLPVAAFELENDRTDDRVAYSLWKVLCVRANLRVVFAFRHDWDESRKVHPGDQPGCDRKPISRAANESGRRDGDGDREPGGRGDFSLGVLQDVETGSQRRAIREGLNGPAP